MWLPLSMITSNENALFCRLLYNVRAGLLAEWWNLLPILDLQLVRSIHLDATSHLLLLIPTALVNIISLSRQMISTICVCVCLRKYRQLISLSQKLAAMSDFQERTPAAQYSIHTCWGGGESASADILHFHLVNCRARSNSTHFHAVGKCLATWSKKAWRTANIMRPRLCHHTVNLVESNVMRCFAMQDHYTRRRLSQEAQYRQGPRSP